MKYLKPLKWYMIAVLILGILYGIGLWYGLKSEFSPSVDVPFPLGVLIFVGKYSDPTEAARYPAFHYVLQLPFYAAVMAVLKLTGGLGSISSQWPYGFADPVLAFTLLQLVSRTLSVLMGIGLLLALWKTRPADTNARSHLLAVALLALSAPFTFYSREANLDVPCNFWWALAVLFGWRYLFVTQRAKPELIWAGIFAALAVATKDQMAGVVLGLGLAILFIQPAGRSLGWGERLKNTLLHGLSAAAVYFLAAVALPQPGRWWYHISQWTLSSPNVADYVVYPATPVGYLQLTGAATWDLAVLLSPIGILLALFGFYRLARSKRVSQAVFFLLPALTYVFMIIMSIRFVYERYMLPVAVVMVPVAAVGASNIAGHARVRIRRLGFALAVLGLVYQCLVGYLPVTYMQTYDTKRQLAASIDQYVALGSPLLVETQDIAHFPNADVYTRYRLMPANGEKPAFASEQHLYADYAPGAHCLLSSERSNDAAQATKLLTSWEYPQFVHWFVEQQILTEYYLYDVDGKCAAPVP